MQSSAAAVDPRTLLLRDIHLPEGVGWWPPPPGWWLVAGLVCLSAFGLLWWRRRYRRGRYRRLALAELDRLAEVPAAELAAGLSRLLRRASLCHFPLRDCAGLSGEAWLAFLDRPFADRPFSDGIGRRLLDAPYRPDAEFDRGELLALCRRWLRQLPPVIHTPGRER